MPFHSLPVTASVIRRWGTDTQQAPVAFGLAPVRLRAPFWRVGMDFPPLNEDQASAVASLLGSEDGRTGFAVYDPRRPVPAYYLPAWNRSGRVREMIPAMTVTAISKSTKTITVTGQDGDVVSHRDPIAFDHDGRRHYYQATARVILSGATTIPVTLRPRVSASGLSITAERYKPTINMWVENTDTALGETDLSRRTTLTLDLVEAWEASG